MKKAAIISASLALPLSLLGCAAKDGGESGWSIDASAEEVDWIWVDGGAPEDEERLQVVASPSAIPDGEFSGGLTLTLSLAQDPEVADKAATAAEVEIALLLSDVEVASQSVSVALDQPTELELTDLSGLSACAALTPCTLDYTARATLTTEDLRVIGQASFSAWIDAASGDLPDDATLSFNFL